MANRKVSVSIQCNITQLLKKNEIFDMLPRGWRVKTLGPEKERQKENTVWLHIYKVPR